MRIPTIDVSFLSCTGIIRWLIRCDVGRVLIIDDLPDDDLLTVFDFYVVRYQDLDFIEPLLGDPWPETKRKMDS